MKLSSANINVMVKVCRKASKILIRDFGEIENLQVSLKGPGDFVTASDKKVEKIIIEELIKSRKKFSILSEEIGELKNSNKEIVSGLIFDPIKNEMFYAEKNNGAYFNNQRIRVSKKKILMNVCLQLAARMKLPTILIHEKLEVQL